MARVKKPMQRLETVAYRIAPAGTWFDMLYYRFLDTPETYRKYKGWAAIADEAVEWLMAQGFGFEVYERIINPGDLIPGTDRRMVNGDGAYQYLYLGIHDPDEALFFQFRWRGIEIA